MIPSPAPDATAPVRNSWTIARDIFIAPMRAFDTLATRPAWLPAYLLIFLVGLAATALAGPGIAHLNGVAPLDGGPAHRPPAELATANRTLLLLLALEQSVIVPLVVIGMTATALTVIARLRNVATPYGVYVSLAANCLLPATLGSLVGALGVWFHDPRTLDDYRSLVLAVPDNLAIFSHPGNDREVRFLGEFDVFNIWSYVLLGYGIARFTPLRLTAALVLALALDFCFTYIF